MIPPTPDTPGNPDISEGGQISYDEAVRIDGNVEIESGTAGSGYIKFLLALDGDGIAGDDNLILNAADGVSDISFSGIPWAGWILLESLTIIAAHNVTFDHEVIYRRRPVYCRQRQGHVPPGRDHRGRRQSDYRGCFGSRFRGSKQSDSRSGYHHRIGRDRFPGRRLFHLFDRNGSIILMPTTVGTPIEISSPPDSVPHRKSKPDRERHSCHFRRVFRDRHRSQERGSCRDRHRAPCVSESEANSDIPSWILWKFMAAASRVVRLFCGSLTTIYEQFGFSFSFTPRILSVTLTTR